MRTTNAGGAVVQEAWWPRLRNNSSATAAGGGTSRKDCSMQCEKQQAGKRPDADTCRSLSCFAETKVLKRWWTPCWLLKSGSSRPNDGRDG